MYTICVRHEYNGAISTSNNMFECAIWDKLTENSKFLKIMSVIYPKNCPNKTCGLVTG